RHTRSNRDWSSDVCSSDLSAQLSYNSAPLGIEGTPVQLSSVSELRSAGWTIPQFQALGMSFESAVVDEEDRQVNVVSLFNGSSRSEERRVGKEWSCGRSRR